MSASSYRGAQTIATTSSSSTAATSNMSAILNGTNGIDDTTATATHSSSLDGTKLYSREEDIAKLVDAYVRRDERHLVLLVGQPGNGKTTLAHTIQQRVIKDNGYFIQGRYDPLEHPEPFAPFVVAATQYLEQILQQQQNESKKEKNKNNGGNPQPKTMSNWKRVKNALSRVMDMSELQVLATMIPAVGELFDFDNTGKNTIKQQQHKSFGSSGASTAISTGSNHSEKSSSSTSTTASTTGTTGRSSFLVTFCNFMRAISHPKYPIVLFLDDLQSSDAGSLEVLKILVADTKIQGFLCMVAFRPVGVKHPFSLLLRTLEGAGINFVPILPTPLTEYDVQQWMYLEYHDLIQLMKKESIIANICSQIATGTKGNPLAIKLCLQIMSKNRDIVQDTGGKTPLQSGGDVKTLFKLLFVTLSATCQKVCWIASCMGMIIDTERLSKIVTDDIMEAIVEAEQAGIMTYHRHPWAQKENEVIQSSALKDCIDTNEHDLEHGYFMFTISTYKDCIYNMISMEDRKVQHTAIGNIYRLDVENVGIYRVVAHMRIGIDLLSPKGKEAFAQLCYQAGKHNSSWTEFVGATKYLDLGIKLLDDRRKWRHQYDLALALYSASAEVYNCTGKYAEMDKRLMEVLHNTRDNMDKLPAYMIQMKSLSSRTMHTDAISLGLKVLPKLGEPVASRRTKSVVDTELKSVKKLLEAKTENDILVNGKIMKDKKKLGAMTILNLLLASSFLGQGELVPLVACRMVRATLQHGVTGSSAVGLSVVGAVLCGEGDIELGSWCSEIALKIVDQLEDKSCKGRVMAIHWGILSRYQKSWKQCQEPLKLAYRLCMEGGDNEFALVSPVMSILNMVVAGGPLASTAEAMKSVYQLLFKKDQDTMMRIIRPFFQEVLNLMGATLETDPVVLSGSIMNEEEDLRFAQDNFHVKVVYCIHLCQAELAFLMHKFQRAKDLVAQCNELGANELIISSLSIKLLFLDAISSVALCWEADRDKKSSPRESLKKKKKHLAIASACLQKLEDLQHHAPENLTHKVLIIQAELKALDGDIILAETLYKRAMDHAEQYGAIGDHALACERIGIILRQHGKEDHALDYLEDCCGFYRQWGALVKVNHVKGNVIPQAIYEWDE